MKVCVYGTLREGQGNHKAFLDKANKVGTTKLITVTNNYHLSPVTLPLTQDVCSAEIYEVTKQELSALMEFEQGFGYEMITIVAMDDITLELHECALWVLK